ncbi:hypothetical protein HAX39_24975 [Citrobacter freundii]|nr:hypothetical protein [Citrobacter freundii]
MNLTSFYRRMEITKLIISITVPVAITMSGYYVQRSIVDFESHREFSQSMLVRIADRRLTLYDQIKIPLNQIYCYIEEICDWEKFSAEEIKNARKKINRIMYSDQAIWSPETFKLYSQYMDEVAFKITGNGSDSQIRAEVNALRQQSAKWTMNSSQLFTGEMSPEHRIIYRQLLEALATDLILTEKNIPGLNPVRHDKQPTR